MGDGRLADSRPGRIPPGGFQLIGQHRPNNTGAISSHLFQDSSAIRFPDVADPHLNVSRFTLPQLSIGRVQSLGHGVDIADPDAFTLLLPADGRLITDIRGQELSATPGMALLLPPEFRRTRSDASRRGTFMSHVFVIPRQLVLDELARLGLARRNGRLVGIRPAALTGLHGAGADLIQLATLLCRDIDMRARSTQTSSGLRAYERLILDKLIDLLLPDDIAAFSPAPQSRAQLVTRALAYMHENLGSIDSVAQIATALGIGRRTVELAFRHELQLSPAEALRDLRLDAVRGLLTQRPDASITDLALGCGFTHLGRFAQQFRDRFGMLPSALRRPHQPHP
jgi:AraC-like DNA-binding protein